MEISKDDVKDVAMATVKGAVSGVPIVGGLFAEYIGLAQDKIADKRILQSTWVQLYALFWAVLMSTFSPKRKGRGYPYVGMPSAFVITLLLLFFPLLPTLAKLHL